MVQTAPISLDQPIPCGKAPEGFNCTRDLGHEGPCAAVVDDSIEPRAPEAPYTIHAIVKDPAPHVIPPFAYRLTGHTVFGVCVEAQVLAYGTHDAITQFKEHFDPILIESLHDRHFFTPDAKWRGTVLTPPPAKKRSLFSRLVAPFSLGRVQ